MAQTLTVQGVSVPSLMYGTAWKEERTRELTALALAQGFRAIDTANQRKHYHEAGVGEAIAQSGIAREQLFIQTKFTYARGQDHRLPYDPAAPVGEQVRQSFARSLEHLGVSYLDSYVLHGPWANSGWSEQDRKVWRVMEELKEQGLTRMIGLSNASAAQLELLSREATVQPVFVQNRCYARTGWDREVRALCASRGIVYQGFSLLTANRHELALPAVEALRKRHGGTLAQLVFAMCRALGMLALTGTSDARHMREDLASAELALTPQDVSTLERVGER